MKTPFTEYFYYTRQERRGTLILIILTLILNFLPYFYQFLKTSPAVDSAYIEKASLMMASSKTDLSTHSILFSFDPNNISEDSLLLLGLSPKVAQNIINYRKKIQPFKRKEDLKKIYTLSDEDYQRLFPYVEIAKERKNKNFEYPARKVKKAAYSSFPFDPNTVDYTSLLQLGFSTYAADNLLNYREKGGQFKKISDVKKIYGVEDTLFDRIKPFIIFEQDEIEIETSISEDIPTSYKATPIILDINQAGIEEWQQLYGIGPAYAKRIVRFREALGGFVSIDQIKEVYGLPDSTFQQIKPFLQPSPLFKKININIATEEELKKHPYINWKQARVLYNYKIQHPPFENIQDLEKVKALPKDVIAKLEPYLEF